jgi:uncharacterized membrane protein (DUF106 family)
MKVSRKLMFIVLVALIATFAVGLLVDSANAATGQSCQTTITSSTSGVGNKATYSFVLTNDGTTQIGDINVTIPGGYSNVEKLAVTKAPSGQNWNISQQANYFVLYGAAQPLSNGQSVTFGFDAKNPSVAGKYTWKVGVNESTGAEGLAIAGFTEHISYPISITSLLPAIIIFGIAGGIAFLNTGLNRFLINLFIGWEQYRVMQKEMNEYRQETMAAARAQDKKQMEKLKKRQSQINAMQSKMMKPQMVQLAVSFLYIFVWIFLLTPTFGNTSMVFVPGFGPISVIYWYPIASFFLGLVASRVVGIMPIEP